MIFDYIDYRSYLKQVALEKREKNLNFSMRAMANFLGIAPSTFSEVLTGKKNLSMETASFIAAKLGLKIRETEYFCLLVQMENAKKSEIKELIQKKINALNPRKTVNNLTVDYFRLISDWYHFAIISCLELDDFDFTPANLASGMEDGQQPAEGPNKFEDNFPVKIHVVQNSSQLQVTVTEKGNVNVKQSNSYTLNLVTTSELDRSIRTDSASCLGDKIVVTSTYTQKPDTSIDPNLPAVSSQVYEKTESGGLKYSEVTLRPGLVFNRILFISK